MSQVPNKWYGCPRETRVGNVYQQGLQQQALGKKSHLNTLDLENPGNSERSDVAKTWSVRVGRRQKTRLAK